MRWGKSKNCSGRPGRLGRKEAAGKYEEEDRQIEEMKYTEWERKATRDVVCMRMENEERAHKYSRVIIRIYFVSFSFTDCCILFSPHSIAPHKGR